MLPWILLLILNGTEEIPTESRFHTEADCVAYGERLALAIRVDLTLNVDPVCRRIIGEYP